MELYTLVHIVYHNLEKCHYMHAKVARRSKWLYIGSVGNTI